MTYSRCVSFLQYGISPLQMASGIRPLLTFADRSPASNPPYPLSKILHGYFLPFSAVADPFFLSSEI